MDNVHYKLGKEPTSQVLELEVWNVTKIPWEGVADHRPAEISSEEFDTEACAEEDWENCFVTGAVFDVKWSYQLNSILNIIRTFFIILVLGLGALFFSKDANDLVLRPLERMIKTVGSISFCFVFNGVL